VGEIISRGKAPSDETAWVNNAVSSLTNMKNLYHLDGFDIDYEQNLDGSFVRVMDQVVQAMIDAPNFPPRFQTGFSVTPFGQVYQQYQQLFTDNTSWITKFNYQVYADGLESQGVQGYLNKYASLPRQTRTETSMVTDN
jgi:hypothetical protein